MVSQWHAATKGRLLPALHTATCGHRDALGWTLALCGSWQKGFGTLVLQIGLPRCSSPGTGRVSARVLWANCCLRVLLGLTKDMSPMQKYKQSKTNTVTNKKRVRGQRHHS